MDIEIEGRVSDIESGAAIKDIRVKLISNREILSNELSDIDGRFSLRVKKAHEGVYSVLAHEEEGGFRYPEKEEVLEIDSLPYHSHWDILLSKA